MNFFDYCFYRAARAYKKKEDDYVMMGAVIMALTIASLILFIIIIIIKDINLNIIYTVAFPVIGFSFLFFNEKRYLRLENSYDWENEKNRKLKGWLVALFLIGSLLITFATALYINLTNRGII